jgi:Na+:H+ antiporter, NhaA family
VRAAGRLTRSLLNEGFHVISSIRRFIASEAAGGLVLAAAAVMALALSNSDLAQLYTRLVQMRVEWRIDDGALAFAKPLQVWVNDLWMAVFFFLVGLEIKREVRVGELASLRRAALPAFAAVGGMALPALVYAAVNRGDPLAMAGWAIPMATDIAFALGILLLLGRRVPASLKVFLTAVAIIDDLGAIAVIALFYTARLSLPMLAAAAAVVVLLVLLNRSGVGNLGVYAVVGLLLWACVLKSGVHATLAGVVTALAVPMAARRGEASPLERAEAALHPWVAFVVLPVFAFVNAGVAMAGVSLASVAGGIPLGIALGLVAGKSVGVFGASWLAVRYAGASWPVGATTMQFFGVSVLCGIGFTMSLFIGGLAFDGQPGYELQVKLGVLFGSLVAGIAGAAILVVSAGGAGRGAARPR